jgi:hypothetical protein
MKRIIAQTIFAVLLFATTLPAMAALGECPSALETGFRAPPASARPWVYWFPLDGNLSRAGITADLEAMARAGIGGVLYMETDQGAPKGPARFGGPLWRELFQHICSEAHRLGLQVNMNNDAGWCGSGGPWITPELSMQHVVWSETKIAGPRRFDAALPQPKATKDYYRDIAVFAYPTPAANYVIPHIRGKSAAVREEIPSRTAFPAVAANAIVRRERIVDLTAKLGPHGRLSWDVPAGNWTLLRMGHTSTGVDNHPAPLEGRGLECDKLSKAAAETQFNALMGRLIAENRPLAGENRTLVSTHIDSWEVGSQNWTPRFRQEFQRLRGYDPLPLLPVMSGRVVESVEVSDRFLWDVRQTVNDLLCENYAGHFRTLAHRQRIRLSIEAYDTPPCDDLTYAGRADEPMAEFWSWGIGEWPIFAAYSCTEMASAAHVYGRAILGAESFTATDREKWQAHPANLKTLGDWAFCEGINRFVFHRYALQPWTNPDRPPGMSMGPWGLHYERTQTWWEQSRAWHQYLARCQFMLQQGLFVADLCFLAPESSPQRFKSPVKSGYDRPGYNFDACPAEVLLTRMSVKDGRLVLPDGMSYRMLVLPRVETMTPRLLAKIRDLVEAGATVLGTPPRKSPSLQGYPKCDAEVQSLARQLWGDGPAASQFPGRSFGKGRVIQPREIQKEADPAYDGVSSFASAKWIWFPEGNPARSAPPGTRYFRRMVNLQGAIASARLVMTADNTFECWINGRRAGSGEAFTQSYAMDVAALLHSGANLIAVAAVNTLDVPNPAGLVGALDVKYRDGRTEAIRTDGRWEATRTVPANWTNAAAPSATWNTAMELGPMGMRPWGDIQEGFAVVDEIPDVAIPSRMLAQMGVPPDFQATARLHYIHKRIGETDVYFVANPEPREVETLATFRVSGRRPEFWSPDTGRIQPAAVWNEDHGCTRAPLRFDPGGSLFVVFRQAAGGPQPAPGGKNWDELAPLQEISGPWEVRFDPRWGGPAQPVTFAKLDDWSKRPEPGIRYYSGTAVYRKTFALRQPPVPHQRVFLDLGKIAVMAEVKLNGRDLGVLWKPPFRVEVGDALTAGDNTLELRVVNLWINRLIGDEQLPEDSDRNANGTLKSWPTWLVEGKPSPTGRYTFTSWRLWKKGDPLVESGLLGPVTLQEVKTGRVGACTHAAGSLPNCVPASKHPTEPQAAAAQACQVSEDEQFIRIETPQLAAAICKKGYVSGVARQSFLDKKSGFRDPGFGLDIVDWILEPGSDAAYRDRLAPDMIYQNDGQHHLYHGSRPKRNLEGPQICTRAGQLQPSIIRGRDFVAIRQQFTYRLAAPGKRPGSVWTQLLVFPAGKRYFISMDKIDAVNSSDAMILRLDMPGHVRHTQGDTFSEIFLSYRGRIPAAEFLRDFPPDEKFDYRRDRDPLPQRFIRAYRLRDPATGKDGPWLAGMTLDPAMVWEAWCHQRGYVCMIEEFGGRPIRPGQSFSAAFIVGYFDTLEEIERVYDAHKGYNGLLAAADGWQLTH